MSRTRKNIDLGPAMTASVQELKKRWNMPTVNETVRQAISASLLLARLKDAGHSHLDLSKTRL